MAYYLLTKKPFKEKSNRILQMIIQHVFLWFHIKRREAGKSLETKASRFLTVLMLDYREKRVPELQQSKTQSNLFCALPDMPLWKHEKHEGKGKTLKWFFHIYLTCAPSRVMFSTNYTTPGWNKQELLFPFWSNLSIYLTAYLSVCLSIHPSVCPSV